ncbi:MAG: hypothetical protein N2513_02260 [Deltaproteobacteria bacterium]|nr:hypothetical protein [Deltaproteobacteria bacterium]
MRNILIFLIVLFALILSSSYSADKLQLPKEYGVYVKTPKGLIRLMPNIVFIEEGIYYIESLSPPRFLLKDVEYFIIYGDYNIEVLTFNPMEFFHSSLVGKPRFIFGRDISIEIKKLKDKTYMIKSKEVLGRGYFSLWIEDSAWDFIIE